MEQWVTASHALRLHIACLSLELSLGSCGPPVLRISRSSPQRRPARPGTSFTSGVLVVWQELTYHKGPQVSTVGVRGSKGTYLDGPKAAQWSRKPMYSVSLPHCWHYTDIRAGHTLLTKAAHIQWVLSNYLLNDFVSMYIQFCFAKSLATHNLDLGLICSPFLIT